MKLHILQSTDWRSGIFHLNLVCVRLHFLEYMDWRSGNLHTPFFSLRFRQLHVCSHPCELYGLVVKNLTSSRIRYYFILNWLCCICTFTFLLGHDLYRAHYFSWSWFIQSSLLLKYLLDICSTHKSIWFRYYL